MQNIVNPVLSQILTNLIQLGAVLLFAVAGSLWRIIYKYLRAHLSAKEMEILQFLGNQAYVFAESAFKNLQGPQKLAKAMEYLQREAEKRGIPFQPDSARAAVEHAWFTFEGQFRKEQEAESRKNAESRKTPNSGS